jgi:aspartate/methionine/tyrosine aminotransferase
LPLWIGEGDLPTPAFINEAASQALLGGETFYTWTQGIPELRQSLSRYYARHFDVTLPPDNFYVTGSGMQSIVLAVQTVASPGDEIIYLSPAWPNIVSAVGIADVKAVPVTLDFKEGHWSLDVEKLLAAVNPRSRALFINTPSNPTGWTASLEDLRHILDLARAYGLWIIADEIYAKYVYADSRAPSFLDVMEAEDRIIFANSFSKNWSMTGWRVGWLLCPADVGPTIQNLIQYSTSGVAQFMQRGAVAALDLGDEFIQRNVERARLSRDILFDALLSTNRVEASRPPGAFYAFLKIDGVADSRQAAFDIVDATSVGLAPGSAFGPAAQSFLRACFLRDPAQIGEGAERLYNYIMRSKSRRK